MHYIHVGVRDGNWENGKRSQNNIDHVDHLEYTWPSTRVIQNLKTLAQIETEISVIEFFV